MILSEARMALSLLTRLPVGRIAPAPTMAAAAWAYPLAGLAVGAIMALAFQIGGWFDLPQLTRAFLAMIAGVVATGALHEDGLADCADAIGGRTRARRLEIMRDSRIGSFGTVALVLVLGLQAAVITNAWVLVAAAVISRGFLPVLMLWMPQARPDGFGANAVRGLQGNRVAASVGLTLVAGLVGGMGMLVAAFAMQWGVAMVARRALGGLTGDVLGAAQVLGMTAALIAAA